MGWICYPKTVRQRLNELGLNVIVMQLNSSSFTQFKTRRPLNWVGRNCQLTAFSALFLFSAVRFSSSPAMDKWPSLSFGFRKVFSPLIKSSKGLPFSQSRDLRGKRSKPTEQETSEYAFKIIPNASTEENGSCFFKIILTGPRFCSGISVFVSISL